MVRKCCGLYDSSYCPENRGEFCYNRVKYNLNPNGGNESKIAEINKQLKAEINPKDNCVTIWETAGKSIK